MVYETVPCLSRVRSFDVEDCNRTMGIQSHVLVSSQPAATVLGLPKGLAHFVFGQDGVHGTQQRCYQNRVANAAGTISMVYSSSCYQHPSATVPLPQKHAQSCSNQLLAGESENHNGLVSQTSEKLAPATESSPVF